MGNKKGPRRSLCVLFGLGYDGGMADTATIAMIGVAQGALFTAWPGIKRTLARSLEKATKGRDDRAGVVSDPPRSIAYSLGRFAAISKSNLVKGLNRLRRI